MTRHPPRIGFISLGCPKALVDSERILTQLRAEGYTTSPSFDDADLVVVNTCGFIDAAVEESLDAIGEALDLLDRNPLPAVVLVVPSAAHSSAEATGRLARQLEGYREIEMAQVDLQWVRRLDAITRTLERGVGVLAALLAAAVLLIIGNTIRLEIQNRHSEIEIVKLVGGTNAFIRRPFLYEGFWYGLIGAAIAITLVLAALYLMQGPVERLAGLYESHFDLTLLTSGTFMAILFGSPILGLAGAWLAVGRHLKRIVPE